MSLESPQFATTRFAEGYDASQVDAAVARILAALSDPDATMSRSEVEALRFTPTRLRDGYVIAEVDAWLDRVAAQFAGGGGANAGADADPAVVTPPSSDAVPYVPPAGAQAITEVPSGGTPWLPIVIAILVVGALALLLVR